MHVCVKRIDIISSQLFLSEILYIVSCISEAVIQFKHARSLFSTDAAEVHLFNSKLTFLLLVPQK